MDGGSATNTSGGGSSSTITSFLGSTTNGPVNVVQIGGSNVSLGQKLMASSFPVVIASDQSGVPVTGTFWQTTQPVSGTITANAGTGTFNIQSNASVNVAQIAGTTTSVNNGTVDAGTIRVTLASNSTGQLVLAAGSATIGSLTANQSVNVAQIAGSTISTAATGVQLVGVADGAGNKITTNSITYTAKFGLDSNLLGTLGTAFSTAGKVDVKGADGDVFVRQATGSNLNANVTLQTQTDTVMVGGVNIKEINAVTPLMGNGTTGTGSQRVTLASDSTGIANYGHGATGSAVPAGATYIGGNAATALPTAATAGNLTGIMTDKYARQVALISTIRDLVVTQTTTISASTSETTIGTAVASVFLDLIMIIASNTSTATNTRIDFRDTTAGSVLFSLQSNGGQPPIGFSLATPIPQTTVNTNWTATTITSTTDCRIYLVACKNK
jgi:hypothetical protein